MLMQLNILGHAGAHIDELHTVNNIVDSYTVIKTLGRVYNTIISYKETVNFRGNSNIPFFLLFACA
jgi:hypothetical protein